MNCGVQDSDGFFSDANVCRPLPLPDESPSILDHPFNLPIVTGTGYTQLAQRTPAETGATHAWGIQAYLSSSTGGEVPLVFSVREFRSTGLIDPTASLNPDGQLGFSPFFEVPIKREVSGLPSWVEIPFPSQIELFEGDYLWFIMHPETTSDGGYVNWWLKVGDGLYMNVGGTPLYLPVPAVQAAYRVIYCE